MSNHACDLCGQPMFRDDVLCDSCAWDIWLAKCDADQEAS